MIVIRVFFTGLEFDPAPLLTDRCIRGVIPDHWTRHRFKIDADAVHPVAPLNRWLADHIEGCWSIYVLYETKQREVTIAFEHEFDAVSFVLANGATEALTQMDDIW